MNIVDSGVHKNGMRWHAIPREEVIVGDIYVGSWHRDDGPDIWENLYEIVTANPATSGRNMSFDLKALPAGRMIRHSPGSFMIVDADVFDRLRDPRFGNSIVAPPKKISDYPSQCTRCGRPAYVSAFSVAHQNETAAKDCPARRD